MKTKATIWTGIAWKRNVREVVCKQMEADQPITQARALAEFKHAFPELRNHTIHAGAAKPETKAE